MVLAPLAPTRGSTSSASIKRLLDAGYLRAAERVTAAFEADLQANGSLIQTRLRELQDEAERLGAEGKRLTRSNPILRAYLADFKDVMDKDARILTGASPSIQESAAAYAEYTAKQQAMWGAGEQLRIAVDNEWAAADPEAINRLITYSDGAAWERQINKDFRKIGRHVQNYAIRAATLGVHPTEIVRKLNHLSTDFPIDRAHTHMRTLYMESHRKAETIQQNENVQMFSQVYRMETLDARICVMCISWHGVLIWDAERDAGKPIPEINEHFRGRGTKRPILKGVNRPPPRTGEDWFASLSTDRQKEHFTTPGKYELWKRGDARLRDFEGKRDDPIFGDMLQEKPLYVVKRDLRKRGAA